MNDLIGTGIIIDILPFVFQNENKSLSFVAILDNHPHGWTFNKSGLITDKRDFTEWDFRRANRKLMQFIQGGKIFSRET